jgi:RND family efflux transporter MFP subunit
VLFRSYDGYVVQKHTELGQWVNAGGPVVEFIDLETVLVRIDVPESAIQAAQVGRQVSVLVEALGETFRGKIKHVIPQADVRARTFPIEVELPNADHRLKGGMFVRARVPAGPTEESLVVPRDAVLLRQGSDLVVAVVPSPAGEGMMAMPVPVKLGAEVDDWVAVSGAMLQAGAPVAIKGHDRVYGPQPVQPVPADGPTSQPSIGGTNPAAPTSQPAGR